MHIGTLRPLTQKVMLLLTFMKIFMDSWRVSDSFENKKVEIRFIQCVLENRAEMFLTIHTAFTRVGAPLNIYVLLRKYSISTSNHWYKYDLSHFCYSVMLSCIFVSVAERLKCLITLLIHGAIWNFKVPTWVKPLVCLLCLYRESKIWQWQY